jgi:hypothetical protein
MSEHAPAPWPDAPLHAALDAARITDAPVALSMGHCATYSLPSHGLVVRVGRPGTVEDARHGIRFARALTRFPFIVSPAPLPIKQPYLYDCCPVTFWPFLDGRDATDAMSAFGAALGILHTLTLDEHGLTAPLRRTLPSVAQARVHRFAASPNGTPERVDLAREVYREIEALVAELPNNDRTLLHGDAYPSNALVRNDGSLVLIDYDCAGLGPTCWDLAPVHVLAKRFRLGEARLEAFRAAYADHSDGLFSPAVIIATRIRELGVITWLLDRAGHNDVYAKELDHRLATRDDGGIAQWTNLKDLERLDA